MARPPQSLPPIRAPRVSLRGMISVIILLENRRQLSAKLHQLSLTGGLLELANYLDERSAIALGFHLGPSFLQAKAQMLFPMRGGIGYMQPFRFTAFAAGARQTLEREIPSLLKQPLGAAHGLGIPPKRYFLDSF